MTLWLLVHGHAALSALRRFWRAHRARIAIVVALAYWGTIAAEWTVVPTVLGGSALIWWMVRTIAAVQDDADASEGGRHSPGDPRG